MLLFIREVLNANLSLFFPHSSLSPLQLLDTESYIEHREHSFEMVRV